MVSVIIVNWNGRPYLEACIASVLGQTYAPLEVLVVDNGSSDGSVEFLHERFAHRITLLAQNKNHGFAGGVNIGIRAAQGEYIALLNNDAVADSHWIAAMVSAIAPKASVGM